MPRVVGRRESAIRDELSPTVRPLVPSTAGWVQLACPGCGVWWRGLPESTCWQCEKCSGVTAGAQLVIIE